MTFANVKSYLEGPFNTIDGWCSAQLWQMIQPIAEYQDAVGDRGPVCEIGVYHGKFLFGLMAIRKEIEYNYAIDVFDMQEFNLDGAGIGSADILKHNLLLSGFIPQNLEMVRADSMEIDDQLVDHIAKTSGRFSFFSVDGCHMLEHTVNDIQIAMRLTRKSGIIFVDDYNNQDWPEVQEAVTKLYHHSAPRFIPLAFSHNKLLLCHLSYHAKYIDLLKARMKDLCIRCKNVKRFGYDSITIHLDVNDKRLVHQN